MYSHTNTHTYVCLCIKCGPKWTDVFQYRIGRKQSHILNLLFHNINVLSQEFFISNFSLLHKFTIRWWCVSGLHTITDGNDMEIYKCPCSAAITCLNQSTKLAKQCFKDFIGIVLHSLHMICSNSAIAIGNLISVFLRFLCFLYLSIQYFLMNTESVECQQKNCPAQVHPTSTSYRRIEWSVCILARFFLVI